LHCSCFLLATVPPSQAWVVPSSSHHRRRGTKVSVGTSTSGHSEASLSSSPQTSSSSSFILDSFSHTTTECDNVNTPPSLAILLKSLDQLATSSGTDVRGRFVDHAPRGSLAAVAHAIQQQNSSYPALTPFSAYCFGHALATQLLLAEARVEHEKEQQPLVLAVATDPRTHGMRLADCLARGAESVFPTRVVFCGVATTPACAAFCRSKKCDAAVVRFCWMTNNDCIVSFASELF